MNDSMSDPYLMLRSAVKLLNPVISEHPVIRQFCAAADEAPAELGYAADYTAAVHELADSTVGLLDAVQRFYAARHDLDQRYPVPGVSE